MTNFKIPIYLVSLESDEARRAQLKERFLNYYEQFIYIKAIDGRKLSASEYYEKSKQYFVKNKEIMSPGELGCTLSHIKALEEFLETDSQYALVLEDDVIGHDNDIDFIFENVLSLSLDSLLLCGGQVKSKSSRYRFGKNTDSSKIYKVAYFSYAFVYGTCCYVVTRKSAQQILNYHNNSLTIADKWGEFFKGTSTEIYYTNALSHPQDLTNSHIEKERVYFNKKRIFDKVLSKDVFIKLFRRLVFEVKRVVHLLFKYKSLPH